MERKTSITPYFKYIFIYIIFLVGVIGHTTAPIFESMVAITPFTLFIMSTYVLYFTVKDNGSLIIVWALGTYIVTFTLEAVGVHTGMIFGHYEYGDVLEPSLFDVPLIIGYNWVFVILGAAAIARHYSSHPLLFALITGFIAVIFDSFLEPVAIQLGYWAWDTEYVPLQNYIAWFLISFVAAFSLKQFRLEFYSPVAIHYVIAQMLFFISLLVLL